MTICTLDDTGTAGVRRLAGLVDLSPQARAMLMQAATRRRSVAARGELMHEGKPIGATLLILSGWAARVRQLVDGRRQILSLLLPGDLLGHCWQENPLAISTVVSLSDLHYCVAPPSTGIADLAAAYAVSHALEEAALLAQITRLGRLNAEDRLVDLFLEVRSRLEPCGLVSSDATSETFPFPLTQEMLADATGLTPVHVNRTLQHLRRRGEISLQSGKLTLVDIRHMAARVGYSSPQIMRNPAARSSA